VAFAKEREQRIHDLCTIALATKDATVSRGLDGGDAH
jgi:hypothetical protein